MKKHFFITASLSITLLASTTTATSQSFIIKNKNKKITNFARSFKRYLEQQKPNYYNILKPNPIHPISAKNTKVSHKFTDTSAPWDPGRDKYSRVWNQVLNNLPSDMNSDNNNAINPYGNYLYSSLVNLTYYPVKETVNEQITNETNRAFKMFLDISLIIFSGILDLAGLPAEGITAGAIIDMGFLAAGVGAIISNNTRTMDVPKYKGNFTNKYYSARDIENSWKTLQNNLSGKDELDLKYTTNKNHILHRAASNLTQINNLIQFKNKGDSAIGSNHSIYSVSSTFTYHTGQVTSKPNHYNGTTTYGWEFDNQFRSVGYQIPWDQNEYAYVKDGNPNKRYFLEKNR